MISRGTRPDGLHTVLQRLPAPSAPSVKLLVSSLAPSFESWFDIDSLSEAENVVAVEREQSILSMLHQVSGHSLIHTQQLLKQNKAGDCGLDGSSFSGVGRQWSCTFTSISSQHRESRV